MGIYDRDYYRPDNETPGLRIGMPKSMVVTLILINVAIYLFDVFFMNGRLGLAMAMRVSSLTNPLMWWQLVTSGFAHDPASALHIGANMLMLWFFGRPVEAIYGRRKFLMLYLAMLVFSMLCWALTAPLLRPNSWNVPCMGASGAVSGMVILFALHYPRQRVLLFFLIPIPAWVAGIGFVLLDMFGMLSAQTNVAHSAHLAGVAFAVLYFLFRSSVERSFSSWFSFDRFRPKPRLRIHDPDDDAYHDLDDEADRILDKLHRHGEASLTPKERAALEAYSRRMRQKHR